MQLEAQKYYKTRSGKKVFVVGPCSQGRSWLVETSEASLDHYTANGEPFIMDCRSQIIEEWREPVKKVVYLYRDPYRDPSLGIFAHDLKLTPGYGTELIGSAVVEEGKFAEEPLK